MNPRQPTDNTPTRHENTVGWHPSPLGELCEFIRGVSFDKSDTSPLQNHPDDIPILRAGNIQDDLLTNIDLLWVPAALVRPEQLLRVGDIAICMSSGSAQVVGKTAALTSPWRGSVGAFCGIVRPKNDDGGFLRWWFRSANFVAWRDSQARGANIQNLRFSQLALVPVVAPPLPEQRRIAARLREQMKTVDRARNAANAQFIAVEALPAALLREAFSGRL